MYAFFSETDKNDLVVYLCVPGVFFFFFFDSNRQYVSRLKRRRVCETRVYRWINMITFICY